MRRFLGLLPLSGAAVLATLALVGLLGLPGGSSSPAAAASPAQQIGMRVLLITDSSSNTTASGIAYQDWVNTLQREGVPFDSVVTNGASPGSVPLPTLSSTASDGTQVANYEGVVVATSGTEGLSTAQWTTLQTFEQKFQVRQLTAYAVPSADYGLSAPVSTSTITAASPRTLTAAGSAVLPYLKGVALDAGSFEYEGTPLPGAKVDTLISGPNGSTVLGVFTASDGRQTMFQTFNQNQFMLHSELLRHGELAWLARNTYFGDQRNYLETHIDDNFLADDTWNTATHTTDYNPADALRESPADVDYAANWSAQNNFRIDMLFNGGGSQQYAADHGNTDPLLAEFQAKKGSFGWVNHTWDHPNIDQGCAPAAYIQSEVTKNTSWASQAGSNGTGGLGLSTSQTSALGTYDPGAVVTGEHSGLANLVPGNPGTVDPPEWDDPVVNTTGGTFTVAGNYTYAITDQYSATGGESSASQTVVAVPVSGSVALSWAAVCHAADYKIYRQDPGSTTWTLLTTKAATAADFGSNGPATLSFTDIGAAGASGTPPTVNTATETPYEQNTALTTAFGAAGITTFGSDASKPYPNPATATFANGSPPSNPYPAGSTFSDGSATAVPRYPTNIFYNVSTQAQLQDEYQTIYDAPTCVPITGVTTCNPAGTVFTPAAIIGSVDQNMFLHMMGNDPRPHYFHQTNIMGPPTPGGASTGTPPATAPTTGDGLYYLTMNPLLAQYHQYFADNAPIVQLTMSQIGTLLSEQAGWAAATTASQVTGQISGNVVTVNNGGPSAINIPLTGTTVGSPYAGSQSGWVLAPKGPSTYTALTAWPAPPTVPVTPTPPTGPAPTGHPITSPAATNHVPPPPGKKVTPKKPVQPRVVIQVAPKTVHLKSGSKATVSLKCQAPKGTFCTGKFALKLMRQTVGHSFRIKSGKIARITVKLPKQVRNAVAKAAVRRRHQTLHAKLAISTNQTAGKPRLTRGMLNIKT
jgi:hypothetical protein